MNEGLLMFFYLISLARREATLNDSVMDHRKP